MMHFRKKLRFIKDFHKHQYVLYAASDEFRKISVRLLEIGNKNFRLFLSFKSWNDN